MPKPIIACGHLCLDIIPTFAPASGASDYLRPGRLTVVDGAVISTGGSAPNVGLSLHRLGFPVKLVAKIGRDPLGKIVLEQVESVSKKLASEITRVEGETTSYTIVINPPGIDRIFFHCPGANDRFSAQDVTDQVLEGAGIFHFGYPPLMRRISADGGKGLGLLMSRARSKGAVTSLDMSLPDPSSESGRIDWAAFLAEVLRHVDFFVPSVEELLFMLDRKEFDRLAARGGGEAIVRETRLSKVAELADRALELGTAAVLIKMGDRGAYLKTGTRHLGGGAAWLSRELYAPVFEVDHVAGTTGAGDATIAGFLASVHQGLSAEEAIAMAVAVGACCVEAPDATSGVRSWDDTRKRVRSGWRRGLLSVEEPGWRAAAAGLWQGPSDAG